MTPLADREPVGCPNTKQATPGLSIVVPLVLGSAGVWPPFGGRTAGCGIRRLGETLAGGRPHSSRERGWPLAPTAGSRAGR